MSGLITWYATASNPAPREVVLGATTAVDWAGELDGVAATITLPTLYLKSGSTTLQTYTTAAGNLTNAAGVLTASVVAADISARSLWEHLWMGGNATVNGKVETIGDRVLIVDYRIRASCPITDITEYYLELAESGNLPSGKTTWAFLGEATWRIHRMWLKHQWPHIGMPALIRDSEEHREVHQHMWLERCARMLATRFGQDSRWGDVAEFHQGEVDRCRKEMMVLIRDVSSTAHPDEPGLETAPAGRAYQLTTPNTSGFLF